MLQNSGRRPLVRVTLLTLAVLAALCLLPRRASAGEITLFWSRNRPHDVWRDGQGATLSLGLLKFAQIEVEGARGLDTDKVLRTTYFTAGGAVKLPFTRVTPFVGLGVGVYHQSLGSSWKISTHEAAYGGVKARLADLLVLRVEYRRLRMNGTPFESRRLDSRISAGAGIAF